MARFVRLQTFGAFFPLFRASSATSTTPVSQHVSPIPFRTAPNPSSSAPFLAPHLRSFSAVNAQAQRAGENDGGWIPMPGGMLGLSFVLGIGAVLAEEKHKYTSADHDRVVKEADSYYQNKKFAELYQLLEEYNAAVPDDDETAWRHSRACYELAQISEEPEKKRLIYQSNEVAKRALELNDKHFQIHKWIGISTSAVTDYEGITKKIELSFQVRDHFEQVIALNPADPYGYYLLGKWRWTFAEMPWYTRSIASTFFASPPTSTYEEALEAFLAAEKAQEGFYLDNKMMVAKCYMMIGDKANARHWYELVVRSEPQYLRDHDLVKDAAAALRSL